MTGYRVKYGSQTGTYPTVADVGNQTTFKLYGLADGQKYYFVVTA